MLQRILLVVEPNRNRQVALDRAIATMALHKGDTQVRVLVAINTETTDTLAENPGVYRKRDWFDDLTRPLDLLEVDYDLMVSWSPHFAATILYAARQFRATAIGVPASSNAEGQTQMVSDGELALIRDASCPVMFVRPGGSPAQRKAVLVGTRPRTNADGQPELNPRVIDTARALSQLHGADLHLVYARPEDGFGLEEIAEAAGLAPDRIHISTDAPQLAVTRTAERIGADLLVMGCRERRASQSLRGGILDRLLGEVPMDLLVVN